MGGFVVAALFMDHWAPLKIFAEICRGNMEKTAPVAPVVKWVGGKRQLLGVLAPLVPKRYGLYCEPFLGGGALLFHQRPARALLNDINAELINVYEVIKKDVEKLVLELGKYRNDEEQYYEVRDWDRDSDTYGRLSPVRRAARIIYLNKTCYNGLFRVNNAGEFNTPFGRHKQPNIQNAPLLRAVSRYFQAADLRFTTRDYAEVLAKLPADSFVYLDPPYYPVSKSANFTNYTKIGFDQEEQIRLKNACDQLDRRGIRFMLSNSAADFILDLYSAYNVRIIKAKRAVNSVSTKRGDVDEIVVRNYE